MVIGWEFRPTQGLHEELVVIGVMEIADIAARGHMDTCDCMLSPASLVETRLTERLIESK